MVTDIEAITPDTTLERVVALRPEARGALRALGVDLCCGGALTLREASELKGAPLEELLRAATGQAAPPATDGAAPPRVQAHDTIRSVLARAPELAVVFEKHGLGGCGGPQGPEERLDLFAKLHHVDLEVLLRDLNAGPGHGAGPGPGRCAARPPAPAAPAPPATLYRRFVIAALLATMTLGATLGAYQLMALHMAIGDANPSHARSHANFQVMGFVLLFIMGVSYHALPRFLSAELALERWARRSFGLMIAGLFVRNYALLDPLVPYPTPALAVGTVLEVAAVAAWSAVLVATWRRTRPAPELFHAYLATGTAFWAVAAVFLAVGAGHAVVAGEVERAASWNEPHYLAALLGGAVLWVEGMFLRTAAFFLGLAPARGRLLRAALALGTLGPLVALGGSVAGAVDVRAAGLLVTGVGVVCFALGARIFERRAADADPDRHLTLLLRLAVGSAVLFSILSVLYAAPGLFGVTMRSLVYDGARHALTVGFITVTIFAMAGRIMPVFAGAPLRWRPLWAAGGYTIVLGVLLRETEVICGLGGPDWLLRVSGTSGYVAAAGVCAASASILGTLRAGARRTSEVTESRRGPIGADSTVAEVLASSPRALEILIAAGFDALRNPVLRATITRGVTLRQACAMKRLPVDEVLAALRAAAPPAAPRRLPVSV